MTTLASLKVLDLSRVLAGPWCGQLLADLGADVVKVEKPQEGDDTRRWGPPYLRDDAGQETRESAYYLSANRGKRSITVDISTIDGQTIIRRLAEQADVVLENYKVGGLKKYGLDYTSLQRLNPGIIYCSITGFGQTGPDADKPGYDLLIQALSGLMSITGDPEGEPMKTGVPIVDLFTGMYASTAILAALHHRSKAGVGQHIDIALLDVAMTMLANQGSNYLISGEIPQRRGNAHPNIAPYQVFETLDGHVILAIGNDDQFKRFCSMSGCGHIAVDPEFSTNELRVQNRGRLVAVLTPTIAKRTTSEWIDFLDANKIPGGGINDIMTAFNNPQLVHRQAIVELDHPSGGKARFVRNPIRFSATHIQYRTAPPLLGQHTTEVMSDWLGEAVSTDHGSP